MLYNTQLNCPRGRESGKHRDDEATVLHAILNKPTTTLLSREWAKAALVSCSWKDALDAASSVSIFYCSISIVGHTLLV